MFEHVVAALRRSGLEVVVAGRVDAAIGLPTVGDAADLPKGPAAGLLTVLRELTTDVVLVAVDQPLLRPQTVEQLLALEGDAVVPAAAGHPQVTCGVYRLACRDALEELMLQDNPRLRRLLPLVRTTLVPEEAWRDWGEDGRSWLSVDTPEQVIEAEALL